jgi:carbonyl reductase 1
MATAAPALPTTAIVTGSNRGIGFEIARLLAAAGLRVVATARDAAAGAGAAEKIRAATGNPAVVSHQLDIADAASVARFAAWCAAEPQRPEVLVNNAGMAFKGDTWGAAEATATIDTNYRGTKALCEALAPLLPDGRGRIINVGSFAGKLGIVKSEALKRRFAEAARPEELDALAAEFEAGVARGDYAAAGWPRCEWERLLA